MGSEPDWDERVAALLSRSNVPAARAAGALLGEAKERWEGRVVPRTSMHDLLFTVPGYLFPFEEFVRASWADHVFTVSLMEGPVVRTADRCRLENAAAVLDAHLAQLVSGEPGATPGLPSDGDRVLAAVRTAWETGCPVAANAEDTAVAALRLVSTIRHRRRRGSPSREERVEDLAKGLRARFEAEPSAAARSWTTIATSLASSSMRCTAALTPIAEGCVAQPARRNRSKRSSRSERLGLSVGRVGS